MTIEFTTLVPAFIVLMVFFVDSSVIYLSHSEMYSTARDCARRMSTRELTNEQEVREFAAKHLHLGDRNYHVEAKFGASVQCRIVVGIGEAAVFGAIFESILGRALVATAVMSREPQLMP